MSSLPIFVEEEQLLPGDVFKGARPLNKKKRTGNTVNHSLSGPANSSQTRISSSEKHLHQSRNIPESAMGNFRTDLDQQVAAHAVGPHSQLKPHAIALHSQGGFSTQADSTTLFHSGILSDLRPSQHGMYVPPSLAVTTGDHPRVDIARSSASSSYSDDDPCLKKLKRDPENLDQLSDSTSSMFSSQINTDDNKKRKNREAAARCRSRKHDRIRKLEEKSRELMEENDQLERTVWTLRRERDGIREAFMYHLTNDCHGEFTGNF